jgi:predicted  nucleic acid-binding Zn-ribbon protein
LGKNVRILAQLQEIDLKIDSSRGEREALLKEVDSLDAKVEELRQLVAAQITELEAVEEEKRTLEQNMEAEQESISRSETRLRDIKTQKEYQAVSKEIAAAKKVRTDLEEQMLQKITRSDELKAALEEKEKERMEFENGVTAQKVELQSRIDQLDGLIAEDVTAREAAAKAVSPSMMKRYMMLRERRQGIAIVEAKGGSCLGCNMNLPPQVFNSLFKVDNLVACPHCQRLLFLRQEGEEGTV